MSNSSDKKEARFGCVAQLLGARSAFTFGASVGRRPAPTATAPTGGVGARSAPVGAVAVGASPLTRTTFVALGGSCGLQPQRNGHGEVCNPLTPQRGHGG